MAYAVFVNVIEYFQSDCFSDFIVSTCIFLLMFVFSFHMMVDPNTCVLVRNYEMA